MKIQSPCGVPYGGRCRRWLARSLARAGRDAARKNPAAPEIVGLDEVIVTAQKRQQSLQDVPLSVSAFSGDMLKEGRMADIRGIVDFTPGFSGKTEDGFTDALAMRGIATNDFGIGGDPSVAMFVDGIWSGRTGGVDDRDVRRRARRGREGPAGNAVRPELDRRRSQCHHEQARERIRGERGADAGGLRPRRGAGDGQPAAQRAVGRCALPATRWTTRVSSKTLQAATIWASTR